MEYLMWELWKKFLVLFNLGFVNSYVTTFFVLDTIYSMIHYLYYAWFHTYEWIISGGSDVPILLFPLDRVGAFDRIGHFIYDNLALLK